MDKNAPKGKEAPHTQDLQKREVPSLTPSKEILVYDYAKQELNIRMAKDIDLNHCRQIADLPRCNRFWIFIDEKNESELTTANMNADEWMSPIVFEVNLEKLSRRHHMLRFLGQLSTLYVLMEEPGNEASSSHTCISPSKKLLVWDCATRTLNMQSVKDTNLENCRKLDLHPKQNTVPIFLDPKFGVTTERKGADGRSNRELAWLYLNRLDHHRILRSRGQLSRLWVLSEVYESDEEPET